MVLALTWWGWSGLIVVLVLMLGVWARRAWRTTARLALVEYLRRELPELRITRVHANHLVFTFPAPPAARAVLPAPLLRRARRLPDRPVGRGRGGPPRVFKTVVRTLRETCTFGARPGA